MASPAPSPLQKGSDHRISPGESARNPGAVKTLRGGDPPIRVNGRVQPRVDIDRAACRMAGEPVRPRDDAVIEGRGVVRGHRRLIGPAVPDDRNRAGHRKFQGLHQDENLLDIRSEIPVDDELPPMAAAVEPEVANVDQTEGRHNLPRRRRSGDRPGKIHSAVHDHSPISHAILPAGTASPSIAIPAIDQPRKYGFKNRDAALDYTSLFVYSFEDVSGRDKLRQRDSKMKSSLFESIDEDIIYKEKNENDYNMILTKWASHFLELKQKGLIPLFITGAGVSMDVETNKGEKIPNIYGIINLLKKYYQQAKSNIDEVNELFQTLNELEKKDKKDRSTVARLLTAFQETKSLEDIWKVFNDKLVDIIIDTKRSPFHEDLANIHRNYDAVTLTLNFDGLLIREFEYHGKNPDEKAFSLPTKAECENFFLRHKNEVPLTEYLEIQVRGDIFYVKCDSDGFCPQKGQQHSLWAFIASYPPAKSKDKDSKPTADFLRKCHACGKPGKSFLAFPGSYDKEKSMREMLEIVWKHLSFRIGSVTVAGCSGEWDPLLIAFLGDLLTERDVPLLVIDKEPIKNDKSKYIIEELVNPKIHDAKSLGVEAKEFIKDLSDSLERQSESARFKPVYTLDPIDDHYWKEIFENKFPNIPIEKNEQSQFEIELISQLKEDKLQRFSQLGLKSYWLDIEKPDRNPKQHNRYQHSLGVMKIASYLYDAIDQKAKIDNPYERQFLRIAALMHDIGHLPFSHLIESVFNELNWKPSDYKERYSHEFQTEKRIDELFAKPQYKDPLTKIGYSVDDLKRLINGCFGVGYLDAIINSPIDSDKIDYIFRDTEYTGRNISLDSVQFLKDISNGLTITPEKHLSFSRIAAMAAAQLIEARQHLYKHLYLQPGIVILEGIVKLIIKTFFVHTIDLKHHPIIEKMNFDSDDYPDYPDLGEYKINYCIDKLTTLVGEIKSDEQYEKEIIDTMFKIIKDREIYLSKPFMKNLEIGYKLICDTKSNAGINNIENKMIHERIKCQKEKMSEIIRDVSFRFPGAAIMEAVSPPDFLSAAHSRKKRERSDGTNTISECIIVPKGDYHLWNPTHLSSQSMHDSSLNAKKDDIIFVFIYPLSGELDDSCFKQAINFFSKLLEKNSIGTANDRKDS